MTEAKIELSMIIISYNTKKITQNCLDSIFKSLKNSKIDYETIVVDNASTDESGEMLESYKVHQVLKVIKNNENLGFARANNQAIKLAEGKYILFLNSDIVVLNDAIEKLYNFYQQNEKTINFLGGKLLNENLTPQPSAGPFYTLPVVFGALFLRGDYWGLTRYSPNKTKEVDWVSGACIFTKKKYFEKIGGFDEKIFMYMEEIDLLYRAKKAGFRVFFYPEAKFIHLGSASSGGRTYPILQVYRGLSYFYRKHYNTPISIFLLKFMLQLKAVISLLIGKLTGSQYLTKTYEKALKLATLA